MDTPDYLRFFKYSGDPQCGFQFDLKKEIIRRHLIDECAYGSMLYDHVVADALGIAVVGTLVKKYTDAPRVKKLNYINHSVVVCSSEMLDEFVTAGWPVEHVFPMDNHWLDTHAFIIIPQGGPRPVLGHWTLSQLNRVDPTPRNETGQLLFQFAMTPQAVFIYHRENNEQKSRPL
jgi:hypothetical protein